MEPLASFHIVTPVVAKELAGSLPEGAQSLVMSALDSTELTWIHKADICKPLAVYAYGGFYPTRLRHPSAHPATLPGLSVRSLFACKLGSRMVSYGLVWSRG